MEVRQCICTCCMDINATTATHVLPRDIPFCTHKHMEFCRRLFMLILIKTAHPKMPQFNRNYMLQSTCVNLCREHSLFIIISPYVYATTYAYVYGRFG